MREERREIEINGVMNERVPFDLLGLWGDKKTETYSPIGYTVYF